MLLVVLVLIWAAALGPMALRRLSERRLSSSVADFRDRTRRLEHAYPHLIAVSAINTAKEGTRGAEAWTAERSRIERVRARRRGERRRRTLVALGSTLVGTVVLGAIPGLHRLWDLSLVTLLLAVGYLGVLVYLARGEAAFTDRRATIVPLHRVAKERPAHAGLLAASGEPAGEPLGFARRPAFVLVDAPMAASR